MSEHKSYTILHMRQYIIFIIACSELRAEGELLHPMLADCPSEAICRSEADIQAAWRVCPQPHRYEIRRIVVCASPFGDSSCYAWIPSSFKGQSKSHCPMKASSLIRWRIDWKACRDKTCTSYQGPTVCYPALKAVLQSKKSCSYRVVWLEPVISYRLRIIPCRKQGGAHT